MNDSRTAGTDNGLATPGDTGTSEVILVPGKGRQGGWAFLWQFWKDYAERIAHFQTAVLLAIIYLLIAGPTALLARLVGHRFLPQLPRGADTFWHEAIMGRSTESAEYRRQF
jgi:hypothetical protein